MPGIPSACRTLFDTLFVSKKPLYQPRVKQTNHLSLAPAPDSRFGHTSQCDISDFTGSGLQEINFKWTLNKYFTKR